MDALGLDNSRSNTVCNSAPELQGHLHHRLSARTDTRAEHARVTFELRSNTTFHITDEPDNANPQQQPVARTVIASDTIQNQPSDDPVLQRAVAKHIAGCIGDVDGSLWTVREVARGAQGWTFTYICKDSLQAWTRANAKGPQRPPIGSFSGSGGLDPVNSSRPAFDCRGVLTIAFSKLSRGIIVKYEHTPLHRTVGQLAEQLAPVPTPARRLPANGNGSQRTPKAKRPPPADGEEGSRKKKTPKAKPPTAVDGGDEGAEEGTPKKKRTPKPKRPRESGAEGSRKKQKRATIEEAELLMPNTQAPETQPQPQNAADQNTSTAILNVPPAEAERRRNTAIQLLTEKGIDPATLSSEQFNIFANQAPHLQSTSLEMLAKYGAERLRIVHPDDKQAAPNATPTTANQSPVPAPAPVSETPSKTSKPRKKKSARPITEVSIGDGAVVPIEQSGELGTTESALKPKTATRVRKTRGACTPCKNRKAKCTKEHPTCTVCRDEGLECTYPAPQSRRKSGKSAEVVENDDSDNQQEASYIQTESDSQPVGHQAASYIPDAPEPGPVEQPPASVQPNTQVQQMPDPENEEFIPDPNILSGPNEHHHSQSATNNAYYQNTATSIHFPPSANTQNVAENTMPTITYPTQTHENQQALPFSQSTSTSGSHQRRQSGTAASRKSLPTSQPKQTPVPPPTVPMHTANWTPSPTVHTATVASPTRAHQQPTSRPKSRRSKANESDQQVRAPAPAPAAAAPPPPPPQQQQQQHQSPMTRSPYQSAAQPNSRQARRSQTNTPVSVNSRPPPSAPSTIPQTTGGAASFNTPATSSSTSNYDQYSRYNTDANAQYGGGNPVSNNDHNPLTRIGYEPSSYHATTTTAPTSYSSANSYDYGRGSGSTNPLSQALNSSTDYGGTNASSASQWPTSQTRSGQTGNASNAYSMSSASTAGSREYGAQASNARNPPQNSAFGQPQSQNYNSYSSQQPQQPQQQNQQSWYHGFTAANNSNPNTYSNSRQSGLRSNVPAYSSQYSGSDEQVIYNLYGASNH